MKLETHDDFECHAVTSGSTFQMGLKPVPDLCVRWQRLLPLARAAEAADDGVHAVGFMTLIPRLVAIVTWAAHHFGDYSCRNMETSDNNEKEFLWYSLLSWQPAELVCSIAYLMEQNGLGSTSNVSPAPAVGLPAAIQDCAQKFISPREPRQNSYVCVCLCMCIYVYV